MAYFSYHKLQREFPKKKKLNSRAPPSDQLCLQLTLIMDKNIIPQSLSATLWLRYRLKHIYKNNNVNNIIRLVKINNKI